MADGPQGGNYGEGFVPCQFHEAIVNYEKEEKKEEKVDKLRPRVVLGNIENRE